VEEKGAEREREQKKKKKNVSNGYLGSSRDEERNDVRNGMRIIA